MNKNLQALNDERGLWWLMLNERYARLTRLVELMAPGCILDDEIRSIKEAEKMCEMLAFND